MAVIQLTMAAIDTTVVVLALPVMVIDLQMDMAGMVWVIMA